MLRCLLLSFVNAMVLTVSDIVRASVYLSNIYYHLDVIHRTAIVDSHGIVVGRLQVVVKLLSSQHYLLVVLF